MSDTNATKSSPQAGRRSTSSQKFSGPGMELGRALSNDGNTRPSNDRTSSDASTLVDDPGEWF